MSTGSLTSSQQISVCVCCVLVCYRKLHHCTDQFVMSTSGVLWDVKSGLVFDHLPGQKTTPKHFTICVQTN